MTEKPKWTSGSWRVEEGTTLIWGNCNPDDLSTRGMGYPIAECQTNPSGNWSIGPYADEAKANAHLIAAAPDLYEALDRAEAVMSIVEPRSDKAEYIAALEHIRSVMAKARGE